MPEGTNAATKKKIDTADSSSTNDSQIVVAVVHSSFRDFPGRAIDWPNDGESSV